MYLGIYGSSRALCEDED